MNKQLTKQIFGVPSLETAGRIDDSDAANAACAANYRFQGRMHELTAQFEQKASEVRAAYLADYRPPPRSRHPPPRPRVGGSRARRFNQ